MSGANEKQKWNEYLLNNNLNNYDMQATSIDQ